MSMIHFGIIHRFGSKQLLVFFQPHQHLVCLSFSLPDVAKCIGGQLNDKNFLSKSLCHHCDVWNVANDLLSPLTVWPFHLCFTLMKPFQLPT